ncbi:hypothetical protein [Poritiphilus flavus]|uniref:Adhesin domain-containing protein n=1 Tax=Poritiphilus flavus TaxID=2697053 RepID=A0A6L9ED59_9FLAO|nr:hypothetical protein [Poritiphilus flavus]NAS12561.1 hypothetical protein [Poritiphilus flavus]
MRRFFMKRGAIVLLFLIFSNGLLGQKLIEKKLISPGIRSVQVDTANCFEVELQNSASEELTVEASIEGEYSKDLLVKISEEGTTLKVSAGFQPNFRNPNDKLSAHKVVSIALIVRIPQFRQVKVYGTNSNITVSGNYKALSVTLDDGRCILNNVGYDTAVTTASGDILVYSEAGIVDALSKFGTVKDTRIPPGDNRYLLRTTSGNVTISKTDKL